MWFKERRMNTILRIERAVMHWVGRDYRRRLIRTAVANAFARFAVEHPEWVAVYFDQHFLAGRAASFWRRYVQEGDLPTVHELAVAWSGQINTTPEMKRRHIAEMKPAAACFIELLAAELGAPVTPLDVPELGGLNAYA
jgi:hypothetical protein